MHVSLAPSSNGWCQASVGVCRRTLTFDLYLFTHAEHLHNRTVHLSRGSLQPWPEDLTGGTGMGLEIPGHAPTGRELSIRWD